jgi:hypothetical protein
MRRAYDGLGRAIIPIMVAVSGLAIVTAAPATAALTVTDQNHGVTPTAIANALVGGGVTISNVTFTGDPRAAGGFSDGAAIVGIATGIVLSSGHVQSVDTDSACSRGVEGPNQCYENGGPSGGANSRDYGRPGDGDLSALSGYPTYDAAVLEFDFVPDFSTVQFQYVFSSDEYSDYANTSFNDVFGFFINGVNCALVPGTGEPVAINTINNGNDRGGDPTPHNPSLFRDNVRPSPSIDTEMDGLTVVLTCTANVNIGETNHMKLAIADASDGVLDSAVFIQAGSLVSVPCGNGTCETSEGETCVNCPADCGSCCGNGLCDSGESTASCPADCVPPCGNGTCDNDETCTSCPADCGLCFCGNGTCDPSETCDACAADCGSCLCGNGICDEGETCSGCPGDCGPCPPMCQTDCHELDGPCTVGVCNTETLTCESEPANEGEPCTSNACTENPTCVEGVCVGTDLVCDDGNLCTLDSCDLETGCVYTPKVCDDANPCNGIESCEPSSGECVSVPTYFVNRAAKVGTSSEIAGDVGANDAAGSIRLGRLAAMADGTTLTANKVKLGKAASAFDVFANSLRKGPAAEVRGTFGPATLPLSALFCPVAAFTCGGDDVHVPLNGSSGPLAPGSYGTVLLESGATLTLAAGVFNVCSVDVGLLAHIVTTGATTINVLDDIRLRLSSSLGPDGSSPAPVLNVLGRSVIIGPLATAQASISAPDATVRLQKSAVLHGAFCADQLRGSRLVKLDCAGN